MLSAEHRPSGLTSTRRRLCLAGLVLSASAVFLRPIPLLSQTSDPLAEMLKSPNIDTRARAARDIGKSGDRSAVPALADALKDQVRDGSGVIAIMTSGLGSVASALLRVFQPSRPYCGHPEVSCGGASPIVGRGKGALAATVASRVSKRAVGPVKGSSKEAPRV